MPRRQQSNFGSIDPVVNEEGEVDTSSYLVPVCLGMGVAVMGLHYPALPFFVCSEAVLASFGQNDSSARAFTPRVALPRGPIADDASTHAHARTRTHTHTSPAWSAAIAQDNHPPQQASAWAVFCSTTVVVLLHRRSCDIAQRVRLQCMVTDGCQETRGRRTDDCLSAGLFETRRVLPPVTSLAQSERAATG